MIQKKLLLATVISLLVFSECKKGPDDPLISLRTRKARVVGDWKLESGSEISEVSDVINNNHSQYTTTYNNSAYTLVSDQSFGSNSHQDTESGTYTLKISFKKNGDFDMEQTKDGDVTSTKGSWNFTGKVGDYKNKEQIVLHNTSVIGANSTSYNPTGNQTNLAFNIKELRNKKMVLEMHQEGAMTSTSGGTVNSSTFSSSKTEYVLKQ